MIEQKRNELNFEIRALLAIIDMIDGKAKEYENYTENSANEKEYLEQQLKLVLEAKNRMLNIFKG